MLLFFDFFVNFADKKCVISKNLLYLHYHYIGNQLWQFAIRLHIVMRFDMMKIYE